MYLANSRLVQVGFVRSVGPVTVSSPSQLLFGIMWESLSATNCCIIVPEHFFDVIKILMHICSGESLLEVY